MGVLIYSRVIGIKERRMEHFYQLISKYISKEITDNESTQLNNELLDSSENQNTFKQLIKINRLEKMNSLIIDCNHDWQIIKSKIDFKFKLRKIIWSSSSIAASLLFFIFAWSIFITTDFLYSYNWLEANTYNQTKEIILEDGTIVWLNKKSNLKYPKQFSNNKREVILSGEAYFNVAHNKTKPFLVKTNGTSTKVVGTSFVIKAYPNKTNQSIHVLSGKVWYTNKNKQAVFLTKNKAAQYSSDTKNITKISYNTNARSWQNKQFRFKNQTLLYVIKELQNTYDFTCTFKNNNWQNKRITTSFNHLSIDEIFKNLSVSLGFEYQISKNKISIK